MWVAASNKWGGMLWWILLGLVVETAHISSAQQDQHNDVRCKCICPNLSVENATSERKLYIKNVPPVQCDCLNVVITSLYETVPLQPHHIIQLPEAFCPRCICRYEQRNVGVIKFVVMLVMAVIGLLVLYLLVLVLEPLVMKRCQGQHITTSGRSTVEEVSMRHFDSDESGCMLLQGNDEDQLFSPLPDVAVTTSQSRGGGLGGAAGSVLPGRVQRQQDRWKIQLQEQRRNIYEKRTMLN